MYLKDWFLNNDNSISKGDYCITKNSKIDEENPHYFVCFYKRRFLKSFLKMKDAVRFVNRCIKRNDYTKETGLPTTLVKHINCSSCGVSYITMKQQVLFGNPGQITHVFESLCDECTFDFIPI